MSKDERPHRVQLSRRKGWKMPENIVSVARPGRWGNPFRVGVDGDAAECVRKFREQLIPYSHKGPSGTALSDFLLSDANRALDFSHNGRRLIEGHIIGDVFVLLPKG